MTIKTSFAIILCIVAHSSVAGFKEPHVTTGNFIADVFIKDGYYHNIKRLFTYFDKELGFNFIQNQAFAHKLKDLILKGDNFIRLETDYDLLSEEGTYIKKVIDDLSSIIVANRQEIEQQLNNLKKNPAFQNNTFNDDLRKYYTNLLRNYTRYYIIQCYNVMNEENNGEFINPNAQEGDCQHLAHIKLKEIDDEEIIDKALSKVYANDIIVSEYFRSNLKEFIKQAKEKFFDDKIDLIEQFMHFRANYSDYLYNVLRNIFDGIADESYVVDDQLSLITNDILSCISDSNKSLAIYDKRGFIYYFFKDILLPNKNRIDTKLFSQIMEHTLDLLKKNLKGEDIENIVDILLMNAVNDIEEYTIHPYRAEIVREKYIKQGIPTKHDIKNDSRNSRIIQLYIIEVLYAHNSGSLEITKNDIAYIADNWNLLDDFPTYRFKIMNAVDKYFNANYSDPVIRQKYVALYNMFLLLAEDYVGDLTTAMNEMAVNIDTFIELALLIDINVDKFEININENYVIFKLIHLRNQIEYYIDNDFRFEEFPPVQSLGPDILNELFPKFAKFVDFYQKATYDYENKLKDENYFSKKLIAKEHIKNFYNKYIKGYKQNDEKLII